MRQKVTISRRDFLKSTAALPGIASIWVCRVAAAKPVKKKPNIILIMADNISAMEFTNNKKANEFIKPAYRKGWTL